jgi:chromosomal replication initiation ATPase DnaA
MMRARPAAQSPDRQTEPSGDPAPAAVGGALADQLILALPERTALGAQDFLISACNRAAAEMIGRWPQWTDSTVVLVAPAQAGKTHLANVWRLRAGALALAARQLGEADLARAARRNILMEDLDAGIGNERVLFHLINLVREEERTMLITSRRPPGALAATLPDLRSRLRALPLIEIAPPDPALLRAVLVKHFADRQLAVEPHVIAHLALYMEQSMAAAAAIAAELDRAAMASHRRITRGLAAQILARQPTRSG